MDIKARWRIRGATAAMVLLVILFGAVGLTGIRTYTVLSGSMEPSIPTGTLLFVAPAAPRKLKINDVITFYVSENMTATHRIVSIHEKADGLWFQTKGDANSEVDGKLVHEGKVIGSPVLSLPGGGYLVWFLQKNLVAVLLAVCGISGAVLWGIPCVRANWKNVAKKGRYLSQ